MKKIYFTLTFQKYMFNNQSLYECGVKLDNHVIACKVDDSSITFLVLCSDYIAFELLDRCVKRYKLSKWKCLGSILPKVTVNTVHFLKQGGNSFFIRNSNTSLSIVARGQSKHYFLGNDKKGKNKIDVLRTNDLFELDSVNEGLNELDKILQTVKKYFYQKKL